MSSCATRGCDRECAPEADRCAHHGGPVRKEPYLTRRCMAGCGRQVISKPGEVELLCFACAMEDE